MNSSPSNDAKIRGLIEEAERAFAAGQSTEAERLIARAKAAAPNHPLVLNAGGVLALKRGEASRAREQFEQAAVGDGANPVFWINLASSLRKLGLRDEEAKALERALALEPRNLLALLQKASLLDIQNKARAAASAYRNALAVVPRGAQLPQSLQPILKRAMDAVRENNAALEAVLREQLAPVRAHHADADQNRFDHCIDALLGKRRIYTPQPTFMLFPHLPGIEFYPRAEFPWLSEIESATQDIRAEFERVFTEDQDRLEPYVAYPEGVPLDQWAELNHSRKWSVFYLWRDGSPIPEHIARCPKTAALMEKAPRADVPSHAPAAFFSILDAHSHIPPHTGVTNTRLIVHLPLVVPDHCRFRVGAETRSWRPGEAWVFDDTIEHEAWNDSGVPRALLIFDIWNPYLTEAERDLVRKATQAVWDYYRDDAPLPPS